MLDTDDTRLNFWNTMMTTPKQGGMLAEMPHIYITHHDGKPVTVDMYFDVIWKNNGGYDAIMKDPIRKNKTANEMMDLLLSVLEKGVWNTTDDHSNYGAGFRERINALKLTPQQRAILKESDKLETNKLLPLTEEQVEELRIGLMNDGPFTNDLELFILPNLKNEEKKQRFDKVFNTQN